MALRIYNTLTRQKEAFVPLEEGKVGVYVCGPTVYADAHVGHATYAIVFDMVRRYLTYSGYDVTFVTNFTDVDDKIIARAQKIGQDANTLARHFADEYLRHMRDLNVLEADVTPRVSEEISNIIALIQELGERGYVYEIDGDVYFRVEQDEDYGKLSRRTLEKAMSGTRVEEDERKEHPGDFALWKSAKPGEPSWESPWGRGRPGWHIECSAMCMQYLGKSVDIHGGGNDLIFPHHENEIAQSESATGETFVRYWMHNGMLQLGGEKMSKSTGNLITIDEFLRTRSADALRLLIFTGHYRKPIMYTDEALDGVDRSLTRLLGGLRPATGSQTTGEEADRVRLATEEARINFRTAMDDDFNTSSALAAMFELVRAINSARSAGVSGPFFDAARKTLSELADVLGLSLQAEDAAAESSVAARPFVDLLVELRTDLRTAKQWQLADKVRDRLGELGVILEDSRTGTSWRHGE